MKRVLMTILVAGLLLCSGCKRADNTAVIKVNGETITKQEINDIVDKQMSAPLFAQLDKNSANGKMLRLLATDKAVNELIIKKIISSEIAKRDITVSNEDLAKYKENLYKEIGGEDNIKEVLKKNNINANEFDSMIANEIQISKLINSLAPVNVSDKDVKKFYNDNLSSKFTHPDMVRASHILIKDKAKAEKVLAEAKVPNADFAKLAEKYSEDPGSAKKGGDLDFFTKEQMVKPFSDVAFTLKPDTVSDLVQTDYGYHIIKVVDRKKAGVTPYDEVKNEIKKYLEDDKKVQVLQKFIEGQKAQTKIEYLDSTYNPENIKKEVQKIGEQSAVPPQPTEFPVNPKEGKK